MEFPQSLSPAPDPFVESLTVNEAPTPAGSSAASRPSTSTESAETPENQSLETESKAVKEEAVSAPISLPARAEAKADAAKAEPARPDPSKVDAANFDALFAQWKASGDPLLRERLILSQRSMVIYLARRFMDRGELFEDVMQIGMVGLINALDGFDDSRGLRFSTFAIPSISGEMRRYFRDKVWGMRVPRRMQELYSSIQNRIDDMTQKLDRSPTYAEIAIELGVEVEEVVETMEMGSALDPQSLDDTVYGEDGTSVADTIGGLDPDLVAYEEHASLQMALSRLTPKERRVLEMAYFDGYSQADIARQMGVSQMHISRLLRRSLSQLRHLLEEF